MGGRYRQCEQARDPRFVWRRDSLQGPQSSSPHAAGRLGTERIDLHNDLSKEGPHQVLTWFAQQTRALPELLLFFNLRERLAVDTHRRGQPCFKPLDTNFDAAGITVTVVVLLNTQECLIDLLDKLALAISRSQLEAELFFLSRAIRWIRKVRRFISQMGHSPFYFINQVCPPAEQ